MNLTSNRQYLGEGLFETIRVIGGLPCYERLHFERLSASAKSLNIFFEWTVDDWASFIRKAIVDHQLDTGCLKVLLVGGLSVRGLTACSAESEVHVEVSSVSTKQLNDISLKISSWHRDARNPIYQHKSINYLEAIMARRAAEQQGFNDVLFVNQAAHITETSIANIFIMNGNQLITPPLKDGLLSGIMRSRILAIGHQAGFQIKQESIHKNDFSDFDGCFVVNALTPVTRVARINDTLFKTSEQKCLRLLSLLEDDARNMTD